MDFKNLKKQKFDINKLVESGKSEGGSGRDDDRFWKPTVDTSGNGYAVIRFLPSDDTDDLPWAKFWNHGFKGPTGKWLFENSLTTLGQPCPISEMNQKLWNSGDESDKKIVRERKRRLHYVTNILVLQDPGNPDNEGKVFLYDFGKKIFDKVMDAMQPEYPDEKPMNPFDLWEGGDFVIKIRKVDGYRNYDKSEFKGPSELFDGDEEKLEAVCNQIRPLGEFTDPSNFKTYEQLAAKLADVLGERAKPTLAEHKMEEAPAPKEKEAPAPEIPAQSAEERDESAPSSEEEDPLSYFQQFAND